MSAQAIVHIPGRLTATYITNAEGEEIVDWTFSPAGSNAGYFGPIASVDSGDDALDVNDVAGHFWGAVQLHLSLRPRAVIQVEWSE